MKKLILLLTLLLLQSCSSFESTPIDTINTNVYITNVSTAKYSRVEGYIIYKNQKIFVNNGSSGYYYKNYNIRIGECLPNQRITIYKVKSFNEISYKSSDIDVKYLEK